MAFFTSDFQQFFRDLAANNNKTWFDDQRPRYIKEVKQPFERFVGALLPRVSVHMPSLDPDPKKAIFRINRDVRFSQDKTPYKLHASAYLSNHGRKDPTYSGFYFQFGPEYLMFGGGLYAPEAPHLLRVRKHLASRPDAFYALLDQKPFKKFYGEIKGSENKRLTDKGLMEAAQNHPVLLKKQLFFEANLPPDEVERADLDEVFMTHFNAAVPLMKYFEEAMTVAQGDF